MREEFNQESDCLEANPWMEEHVERYLYFIKGGEEKRCWILNDYNSNKDISNFITLAHGFALIGDYENAYKYHYINTKVNNEDYAATNSVLELKNYKDLYINRNKIILLEKEADDLLIEN